TEADSGGAGCTLTFFSERIVADKAEVNDLFLFLDRSALIFNATKAKPFSTQKTYRITALFQNADRGSRRQQAVLDKVKVLLSSEHQTCLSSLLRKINPCGENPGLDLNDLPVKKLLQSMSRMPPTRKLRLVCQKHLKTQE
ncbi:hypothetical protein PtrEW4_012312, partial [Pyrenophora tritici-repentis]